MHIEHRHIPTDTAPAGKRSEQVWIVQSGKWAYDIAVRQLHITDPKRWSRFEMKLKAHDIMLQTGDECQLHNGAITISRNGKNLWVFVIDERRMEIDDAHHEAKSAVHTETKCSLKDLCNEIGQKKKIHEQEQERKKQVPPEHIAKPQIPIQDAPLQTKEAIRQDPYIVASVREIANTFKLGDTILINLIDRESGFDPNIRSSAQAKGMMQVRNIVFADMIGSYDKKWQIRKGHGIGEYLRFFRKIPDSVINRIHSKEAKKNIHDIQRMTGEDRNQYRKSLEVLQKHITDPHVNIIIGSIYLTFLGENAEENPDIPRIVQSISREKVNNLLVAKGKKEIQPPAFQQFKNAVIQSPSLQRKFIALASYNEWYVNKDGHGVNYAAAIIAPTILRA